MRILLPQSIFYTPTLGGENKANRVWMEQLVSQGHTCRVVAPAFGPQGPAGYDAYRHELEALGIRPTPVSPFVEVYRLNGVEIHAVIRRALLHTYVVRQMHEFDPTWVLVSSLDPGQLLLDTCMRVSPSRVVYLAHTPQHFPFGPDSILHNPVATGLLQQVRAVVAIGPQTAAYVRYHTGREPLIVHPPVYGRGPFPRYGRFGDGTVTMVNPSVIKGISIFAALARQFSEIKFAALAGWATTTQDRQLLAEIPNVAILDPVESIDEVLARTSVLVVPSLYREGFGLVVVEAMLRGIPVVASHYAGLIDAKMGVEHLVPVCPIERYMPRFDERGFPVPVVPDQAMCPWMEAVYALYADPEHYRELSEASREAAMQFLAEVENNSLGDLLAHLASVREEHTARLNARANDHGRRSDPPGIQIKAIPPRRRALLASRLRTAAANEGDRP